MVVEPFANDELKYNLESMGEFTLVIDPPLHALLTIAGSGLCLGAQAGEARIREVVTSAGFTASAAPPKTPFNIVYEARPYAQSSQSRNA